MMEPDGPEQRTADAEERAQEDREREEAQDYDDFY
jgi:hypothetical protein